MNKPFVFPSAIMGADVPRPLFAPVLKVFKDDIVKAVSLKIISSLYFLTQKILQHVATYRLFP